MEKLKLGWSPEQICGRMKQLGLAYSLCHETIYQYIYRHAKTELYRYLPRQRSRRRARHQRLSLYHIQTNLPM